MIIGIEGTGSQKWGNLDLQRSFVRKILEQTTEAPARYFIGPDDLGNDGPTIVREAFDYLAKHARHSPRLVLVGYSRGAAYALELCRQWAPRKVDLLVMFDAVARQKGMPVPQKVPPNVKACIHAFRDPRGGSRRGFGNVGLHVEEPAATTFRHLGFVGSHGSLGGVYWDAASGEGSAANQAADGLMKWYNADDVDREALGLPGTPQTDLAHDLDGMRKVGKWMWDNLKEDGLLSRDARFDVLAKPFDGGRIPGVAYFVR